MVWVSRNANNAVVGVYAQRQPGYAEEELADDAAEVVAFQNAGKAAQDSFAARVAELSADLDRQQIMAALKDHPAAIETWVRNQINADSITTLADAKACAKRIETALVLVAKAIALLA